MDNARQQNLFKLSAIGVFLIAAALRLALYCRSLQYDELWSMQFFAPLDLKSIIFDLSLPNNHPLNTIGIKIATTLSDDIFSIRLFPLLCGITLAIPVGFSAAVWCKDKTKGFIAACLAALSAPLIIYSALARGYIIQAFFFALTAAGFSCFAKEYEKKYSKLGFALILAGGIGTILSVPTGVVFLAALVLAIFVANHKNKPHKLVICALIIGLLLSAAYYTATYSALTSAQKWSVSENYFVGCSKILLQTGCGMIIATLVSAILHPSQTLPLLMIPTVVLLSGAVTGLGPVRTYIIFSIIFSVTAAIAVTELFKKSIAYKISAACLLLLFTVCQTYNHRNFILPDWQKADVKNTPTTIAVYPANSSYPLLWNCGLDFLSDYQNAVGKSYLNTVKVYAPRGVFNGMDNSFGEKQIATNLKAAGGFDDVLGEYYCYTLELCNDNIPEKGYFLVAYPLGSNFITPPPNALRLNPHFESAPENKGRCALYFTDVPPAQGNGANIFIIK